MGVNKKTSDVAIIESVLDSLQPYIKSHGGAISLSKYEDGIVYVKLSGACSGCPISFYTLKMGIEEHIKKKLPNVKDVIALDE